MADLRFRASLKDDVSGPLDRIKDRFELIKKQGATGFGLGVGASIGYKAMDMLRGAVDTAASAVVNFVTDSIGAASDLSETVTKTRQIFGESSDEIEAWAGTAADAFGQSKRQALDTASGFAGLFKTVGLGMDESAEMAKKLTVLGSDLASFFNTDVQTAIDSLRSGLSGESEPLRKFNVFLSETAVSAKLAEMGIEKVGGQFTEAQKATARYALILEQTGDAQGDFERTSDGLANTQRTLQAQMEDLSASIGEELIPVALELATFVKTEVVPALQDMTEWAKENEQVFGFLGDVLGQVFNGGVVEGLRSIEERMEEFDAATAATSQSLADFRASEREAGYGADTLAGQAGNLAGGLDDVEDEAKDSKKALRDLQQEVRDTLDAFIEATLGPKQLKNELAIATDELGENQREVERTQRKIEKFRDAGKPVGELKDELRDLRGEVLDGKEEIIRTTARLEAMGEVPMGATRNQVQRLIGPLDDAAYEAWQLYDALSAAAGIRLSLGGGGSHHERQGRAGGGQVLAGETYLVGENGPEILRMSASGNGMVSPNAAGGVSARGASNLTLIPIPVPTTFTPVERQAWVNQAGPAMVDYFRSRGLI